jgi:hypothetical protein
MRFSKAVSDKYGFAPPESRQELNRRKYSGGFDCSAGPEENTDGKSQG